MHNQMFDIGVSYFLRNLYERSVHAFREVLKYDPRDGRAWTYLGMAYTHLGNAPEAEMALSRAIELGSQGRESWFHLGVARSMRSEWPQASSAYRHAVALAPEDMVAWHRLGVALAESGDQPGASVAFERALVLSRETGGLPLEEPVPADDPDPHLVEPGEQESVREVRTWIDLALSLLSLGEEEEAVAAYERAFTLDPDQASRSLFRPMLHLLTAASNPSSAGPTPSDLAPAPPEPRPPRPDLSVPAPDRA